MKILWVNVNFLHPPDKGGKIRTLEMLKRLHQRHELHYVAFEHPAEPQGPALAHEYSTHAYAMKSEVSDKRSLRFAMELAGGLVSPMPLAVGRFFSPVKRDFVTRLRAQENFDAVVCDFLVSAPHFADLSNVVLFQHNVESVIWERHCETAANPAKKFYFRLQAQRMNAYEKKVCQTVAHTIAVSPQDAQIMRERFGVANVSDIPTGVNIEYFAPPERFAPQTDLAFVGSMDWLPNIDGVKYFVREILPSIRQHKPDCSLAIIGRAPTAEIRELVAGDPLIQLTGTVDDVRPYLWKSKVSIVPLRIGGGTRLKIYESMAARVPQVSTSVGAEGLSYTDGKDILIADTPEHFATACVKLLGDEGQRTSIADAAFDLVEQNFSWDQVARRFEDILARACAPQAMRKAGI
jgi:glycosyltransferase involved in cell wall biosynthesis